MTLFSDVDETVIRVKSVFDFLAFRLAEHGDDGSAHAEVMRQVRGVRDHHPDLGMLQSVGTPRPRAWTSPPPQFGRPRRYSANPSRPSTLRGPLMPSL